MLIEADLTRGAILDHPAARQVLALVRLDPQATRDGEPEHQETEAQTTTIHRPRV